MLPFYRIPLDDMHLVQLGKLAAVWGQTDYLLTHCISKLTGASHADCEVLLDRTPMAAKISRFKSLVADLSDISARDTALKFCSKSKSVLGKRNHLMHGVWGMYSSDGTPPYEAACYFPANKQALIFASDLSSITDAATRILDLIGEFQALDETSPNLQGLRDRQLSMGYGPPEGRVTAPTGSYYLDLQRLGHKAQ